MTRTRADTRTAGGRSQHSTAHVEGALLARPAAGGASHVGVQPMVGAVLAAHGRPLDPPIRGFVESRFRTDFSHVRLHTDEGAAESARQLNAHAYTVGSHIVLGSGARRLD